MSEGKHKHPIHLICNHCKQIVQTGIFNVSQHTFTCSVYTQQYLGNGLIVKHRPIPSFTAVYREDTWMDYAQYLFEKQWIEDMEAKMFPDLTKFQSDFNTPKNNKDEIQ